MRNFVRAKKRCRKKKQILQKDIDTLNVTVCGLSVQLKLGLDSKVSRKNRITKTLPRKEGRPVDVSNTSMPIKYT